MQATSGRSLEYEEAHRRAVGILVLGLLLLVVGGAAAEAEAQSVRGHPVVRTFSPQAYDGNGQVWDIAQDGQGLLYIASSYGLQQYDGARWRYLATANETTPWAIARDTTGTLYVGARDELGRYRPDSLGRFTYRSLLEHVPASHRPVGNVREVVAAAGELYFHTKAGVVRWASGQMSVVTDTTVSGLYECRGSVFVHTHDERFRRIEGTALSPVEGSASLREAVIVTMIPGPNETCQVATQERGRFALTASGTKKRPWPGGALDAPLSDVVRGPDGALALATDTTIRLVDPVGQIQHLTSAEGLPSDEIHDLYVSERQALWVATNSGIARVAWPSPVSVIETPPALQSVSMSITRHDGRLFIATNEGLWWMEPDTAEKVEGTKLTYNLLSTSIDERPSLLVAGTHGLLVVRPDTVRTITRANTYDLLQDRRDPSTVYASLYGDDGGLLRLQHKDSAWQVVGRTDRVQTTAYTLAQDLSGALWMGTGHRGILRLRTPMDGLDAAPLARFDTSDGLPAPSFNYTTQLGDSVRFATANGLYRFTDGTFVPDSSIAPVYADGIRKSWFAEQGHDGGIWMDFGGHKMGVAHGWPSDSVRWADRPFRRLADLGDVQAIYPDRERPPLVWLGAENSLVRYDQRFQRFGGHAVPFRTLLRGVQTRDDSLLYGGDTGSNALSNPVEYEHNALRFQFGATSYEQIDGPTHNWERPRQYRWRLAGFEDEWTDWTIEPHADYTGLPPGTYTMRVQARNLYETVGRTTTLSLTILPPWYRTWWACGLYSLLALGLVAGVVQWRTRRLRRRQQRLEETVAERTKEIEEQKEQLTEQAERLQELDEAKSRFFANVSHEFRTPLTLIRGPVQKVREAIRRGDVESADLADQLAIAERNTTRLQRLIDQILDLARLDAGTYELNAQPTDLGPLVERFAHSFEPLADRNGLTLIVETGPDAESEHPAPVYVDREALEHVVGILLSNAFKFTPEGGRVTVAVRPEKEATEIIVQDTGPGIPEAERDVIFDRFQQVDDALTRTQEGTGIGLAFASDLVGLHGGTLTVDSEEEKGAAFTVRLPRGPGHLRDEQLASDGGMEGDAPDAQSSHFQSFSLSSPSPPPSRPSSDEASFTHPTSGSEEPSQLGTRNSQRVLVVDDNADLRRYVRSVLAPEYEVIEAADGAEGLDVAHEALPDCVLADVMMPEMDGIAMVRELKQDAETKCIPVVMLTARAEAEHEREGLEAGADDYVTKPFDADVLRARVAGMIDVRERLRRRIRAELQARSGDGQVVENGGGDDSDLESSDDRAADTDPPQLVVPTAASDESDFVQEVREVIEEHLADPDLDVDQLASAVAVSRSTLYRRLKDEIDTAPSQLIRQVRLEHGARLLREGEGTVSEVAYAVGFNSLSYFSRSFREHLGQSPSDYVEAME